MTTESVAPEALHVWAICLRASEEARRRGDRRYGTDHILLALLENPSIEVVLGVNLQQARQALESLDHEALGALGLAASSSTFFAAGVMRRPSFFAMSLIVGFFGTARIGSGGASVPDPMPRAPRAS